MHPTGTHNDKQQMPAILIPAVRLKTITAVTVQTTVKQTTTTTTTTTTALAPEAGTEDEVHDIAHNDDNNNNNNNADILPILRAQVCPQIKILVTLFAQRTKALFA